MIPPETAPDELGTRYLSLSSDSAPEIPSTTGPLDLQRPWVIEFRVVGTASTIKVRVADSMILGRGDVGSGFAPDVDLTAFDALGKGVSRKHAQITIHDERLMVSDLHSTNGTRLNNVLCHPGEEYRLRHGNELTLGTLRLQVSFAVVPAFTDTQHGSLLKQAIAPLIHSIGKHILVIESDPEVGGVFRAALEGVGYKVTLVGDVIKGFGAIFQGMPDVVVVDLMEPDTNGLDLIRFIRKQKTPQPVPILALSAALAGYQKNQALSAGADTFLGKPVSVEVLLQSVAAACNPPPRQPEVLGLPTDAPAGDGTKVVTATLGEKDKAAPPAPMLAPLAAEAPPAPTPTPAPVKAASAPQPAAIPAQAAPAPMSTPAPAQAAPAPQPAKPAASVPLSPAPQPTVAPPAAAPQPPAAPVVPARPDLPSAQSLEKLVKLEPTPPAEKDAVRPTPPPRAAEPPAPTPAPRPFIKPLNPPR